ncbi:MAG: transposase [Desulfobulbus sp.]|nr:transposase [Desulfobulbus sp.]
MNAEQMSIFLSQAAAAPLEDFIIMALDGASSHKARDLQRPENIRLAALPPYAPEHNPQEHVGG